MRSSTDRPETYSPRPLANPDVQRLVGQALVKSGQKHKDRRMIELGRKHQAVAAGASRDREPTPE